MKQYDVYLSYLKEDKAFALNLKDKLEKEGNFIVYQSELTYINEEKGNALLSSYVYMPIISDNHFNEENTKMLKTEMDYFLANESTNNIQIEAISRTYNVLFSDLKKLDTDYKKELFTLTRGVSFVINTDDDFKDEEIKNIVSFINDDKKNDKEAQDYLYDVFISWTYRDKDKKDALKQYLESKGLKVYDSEILCHSRFTSNFLKALFKSKTYVMLLSDGLDREDLVSDVRREISCATDLEKKLRLNIEILVLSSQFINMDFSYHSNSSTFFYDFAGFEKIDCTKSFDDKLDYIYEKLSEYLYYRSIGKPRFYNPDFGLSIDRSINKDLDVFGREKEVDSIIKAFQEDNKVVILSGVGGIGKTKIAEKFAQEMIKYNMPYVQTVHVSDVDSNSGEDVYSVILSNIQYNKENQLYINSLKSDKEKKEYQEKIVSNIPSYALLIIDNINNLTDRAISKVLSKINANLVFTSRTRIENVKSVKTIEVLPFGAEEIYLEFKNRSGVDISMKDFLDIYESCFGHTMSLFMLASLAKENNYTAEELLEIKENLSNIKDKIWVEHNDTKKELTITEQLKTLFNLSDLSKAETSVLLEITLLNDGLIKREELKEYFNLTNDDINHLVKHGGWLSKKNDYLVMNNTISGLIIEILKDDYKPENFEHVLEYLDITTTLDNPYWASDRLFFALYRLRKYAYYIDTVLFNKYVKANSLIYSKEEQETKAKMLEADNNVENYQLVDLLNTCVSVEKRNLSEEVINKLFKSIEDVSCIEHKLAFSYIMKYLFFLVNSDKEKTKQVLDKLIDKVLSIPIDKTTETELDSRIRQIEGFGIVGAYNLVDEKGSIKKLHKYVNHEKQSNYKTIYIDYSKFIALNGFKKINKLIQKSNKIDEYLENGKPLRATLYSIWTIVSHPVFYIKTYSIEKKINKLDVKHPDERFIKEFFNAITGIIDQEKISAKAVYESLVDYYDFLFENNLTLLKREEFVANTFDFLNGIFVRLGSDDQINQFKEELFEVMQENIQSATNIGHHSTSSLYIAMNIYDIFSDSKSIECSWKIIKNQAELYKENSLEFLYALFDLINNMYKYKNDDIYTHLYYYFHCALFNNHIVSINKDAFAILSKLVLSNSTKTFDRIAEASKKLFPSKQIVNARDHFLNYYKNIGRFVYFNASSLNEKLEIKYYFILVAGRISVVSRKDIKEYLEDIKEKNGRDPFTLSREINNLKYYLEDEEITDNLLPTIKNKIKESSGILKSRYIILYAMLEAQVSKTVDKYYRAVVLSFKLHHYFFFDEIINNFISYLPDDIDGFNYLLKRSIKSKLKRDKVRKEYLKAANCYGEDCYKTLMMVYARSTERNLHNTRQSVRTYLKNGIKEILKEDMINTLPPKRSINPRRF